MKLLNSRIFNFELNHYALSVTRFAFFIVCFCEFMQIYLWKDFTFLKADSVTLLGAELSVPNFLLPLSLVLQLFIAVGFLTRFSLILNYILVHIVITTTWFHYHFDYAVLNFAFIFLFMPKPQVLAVDCYIREKFFNVKRTSLTPVPVWFFLLLFFGVELVYFDSLFYKYVNVVWLNGLSFWMPAALPHFSTGLFPDWAENKWLMLGFSHLALFLETLFPLILLRRLRLPFFAIGFGLHFGIVLFFPIPWFGLGMCAIFLAFLPWDKLFKLLPQYKVYDTQPAFDFGGRNFKTVVGYLIVLVMCLSQLILAIGKFFPRDSILFDIAHINRPYIARAMGLYQHPVYIDSHYSRTHPIIRYTTVVDGKEVRIPSYDDSGHPDYPTISGRIWVLINFHMRKQRMPVSRLHNYWQAYILNWFKQMNLEPREVTMYYKDARVRLELDFTMDDEVAARPWNEAAKFKFKELGDGESKYKYKMIGTYNEEFLKFIDMINVRQPRGASSR